MPLGQPHEISQFPFVVTGGHALEINTSSAFAAAGAASAPSSFTIAAYYVMDDLG
jgi:hypothetical protein